MMMRRALAFHSPPIIKSENGGRSLAALALVCMLVAACDKSQPPPSDVPAEPGRESSALKSDAVDARRLSGLLERCDTGKVTRALGDVLGLPSSTDVLRYLADTWDRQDADPRIVACLQKDLVRVYVANALAQGQSNRMVDVAGLPAVLDALRTSLSSKDEEVVQVAMMGLGDFLTDEDVTRLLHIAQGQSQANSRVAVSTLALSCRPAADVALNNLEASGGTVLRDQVSDARKRVQDARKVKCGSPSA
jgi:hypothetical protein